MWKSINIDRVLKLLLIVAVSMFVLTGCAENDKNPAVNRAAFAGDESSAADAQSTCWQDVIINLLYKNMGQVAMGTYSKITDGALTFMMIAFAVWLSLRLLKHVSSFTEENIGETWTEIAKKFFLCFACGYLASSTDGLLFFMNHAIFPVYNAFLEFAGELLSKASAGGAKMAPLEVFGYKFTSGQTTVCKLSSMVSQADLSGFPDGPREMMNCMICAMNDRMNLGLAMAYKVLKAPGFMATMIGLMIIACFTFVKLGFVFYLVDTIFRFTVMVVMLPILIMGYPFPMTKKWLSQGFLTILNSAAFMMFMAIMIAIAMLALEQIIIDNKNIFTEGMDEAAFTEFSIPFMCLLMIGFLIASSVELAQQVTDSLVGGSSKGSFNAKAKAVIVGVAKFVGSMFTMGAVGAISKVAAARKVMEGVQKGKAKVASFKNKLNGLAGRGGQ